MGWEITLAVLARADVEEWLDSAGADPWRVRESLLDLRAVNRFLGGLAALRPGLRRALGRVPEGGRLRLLDVGTGGADVPAAIEGWVVGRGRKLWAVGVDRCRAAIAVAREIGGRGGVRLVRADALALPFRRGSFDVAISSTTLHHFSGEGAVRHLREMRRVARVGVVIGDLRRSLIGYLGTRLLAATLWRRHAYARHDGPASMRRAYTVTEVRGLLARAGLPGVVNRRPFFRLGVWIPAGTDGR